MFNDINISQAVIEAIIFLIIANALDPFFTRLKNRANKLVDKLNYGKVNKIVAWILIGIFSSYFVVTVFTAFCVIFSAQLYSKLPTFLQVSIKLFVGFWVFESIAYLTYLLVYSKRLKLNEEPKWVVLSAVGLVVIICLLFLFRVNFFLPK